MKVLTLLILKGLSAQVLAPQGFSYSTNPIETTEKREKWQKKKKKPRVFRRKQYNQLNLKFKFIC